MKVGVVGCGAVGATAAYAMVMRGVCRKIVLVDRNEERAHAEADDIRHAVPFAKPVEVSAGAYRDLEGCRVVLLCAGVNQKPGETRRELLKRNEAVFREVVPRVLEVAPDAVLVVATNPVDVMTHLTSRFAADCNADPRQVVGSGTTLDTARFRSLLGTHCGVDSHHVHGYVVGEHGDSEVLTWSQVTVGGMSLEAFLRLRGIALSDDVRDDIDAKVRGAAYSIIKGKGATYYGIGSALARITQAVLHDQRSVLTVAARSEEFYGVHDVTLSLPRLVGGAGVLETFPLPLEGEERELLATSCRVIRATIDELA